MKLSRLTHIILLTAATTVATLTSAFAADALQMQLQANQVITTKDGKVIYEPVSTASTGAVIQYKATYSNVTDTPINDVIVTLPIPMSMTFTGDAYPTSAQATVDGKNFADMPLMRRVDGKLVKIPYAEYKALRWNIRYLPEHKSADVSLNATVN